MEASADAWLLLAKRVQALAQAGLTYAQNHYDEERYQELRAISTEMMQVLSGAEVPRIEQLFANETGYQTPKVDVRAVVVQDGRILLVRENIDGRWAPPGGWADIGLTPREVVVKEVQEEASLVVEPLRLLAVFDKKCHPHPPSPYHTYKLFILCQVVSGTPAPGPETGDVSFFAPDELPPLSEERITASQIELLLTQAAQGEAAPVLFD